MKPLNPNLPLTSGRVVGLLMLDVVLTTAIFWVSVSAILVGVVLIDGGTFVNFWAKLWVEIQRVWRPSGRFVQGTESAVGIFFCSTFFTSVWVWLYALSGLTLRAAGPLTKSLDLFRKTLDVENKPLSSIGFVFGGIITFAWWGFCIVSWRESEKAAPEGRLRTRQNNCSVQNDIPAALILQGFGGDDGKRTLTVMSSLLLREIGPTVTVRKLVLTGSSRRAMGRRRGRWI